MTAKTTPQTMLAASAVYYDDTVTTGLQTNPTGLTVRAAAARSNNNLGSGRLSPYAIGGMGSGAIRTAAVRGPIAASKGNNN